MDAIAKRFSPFPSALIARTMLTHPQGITEASSQIAYGLSMAYHDATAALTSKDYCDKLWQDALALAGAEDGAPRSGAESEAPVDLFIYKQRHRKESAQGTREDEKPAAPRPDKTTLSVCGLPPPRPPDPCPVNVTVAFPVQVFDRNAASDSGLPAVASPRHLGASFAPELGNDVGRPFKAQQDEATRSGAKSPAPTAAEGGLPSSPVMPESDRIGRDSPRHDATGNVKQRHAATSGHAPARPSRAGAANASPPRTNKPATPKPDAACSAPWSAFAAPTLPLGRNARTWHNAARLDCSGVFTNATAARLAHWPASQFPTSYALCPIRGVGRGGFFVVWGLCSLETRREMLRTRAWSC